MRMFHPSAKTSLARLLPILLCLLAAGCAPRSSPTPGRMNVQADGQDASRLVRDLDTWYVAGLHPEVARLMDRGRLLVALRPVPGTRSQRAIAVLRAVGNAREGDAIEVALHCVRKGETLTPDLAVKPVYQGDDLKVGQCLGRILEADRDGHGAFVRIDLGRDDGIAPLDLYEIIGDPLTDARRPMPLQHGGRENGSCHISSDESSLNGLHARCEVGHPLKDGPLEGRFVLYVPRTSDSAPPAQNNR